MQFGGQVIVVTKPNNSLSDCKDVLVAPGIPELWEHTKPAAENHNLQHFHKHFACKTRTKPTQSEKLRLSASSSLVLYCLMFC